jgi:cell division transport system ATP-binding protein
VTDAVVRFEEVGLRYGRGPEVLRGIGLALAPGSFHFLTGSSGAGKSSLLGLMYLALRPSRGVVRLFGTDPASAPHAALPAIRRRIGVVFQDFRLLEHLSAFDNVALPLRVAGAPEAEIQANVTEMLRWVGLGDALDARPSTLSGGQQQRIAIARAVVGRPELLVADEPTGSVDEQTAFRLMRLFEELHKMGTTVVVATHNPYLVETFGHPELHLENGMIERCPGRRGD